MMFSCCPGTHRVRGRAAEPDARGNVSMSCAKTIEAVGKPLGTNRWGRFRQTRRAIRLGAKAFFNARVHLVPKIRIFPGKSTEVISRLTISVILRIG